MQDADAQGIAALRSILNLERKQGYGDKAVVGGMDRFLDQWRSRLYSDHRQPTEILYPVA